MNKWHKVTAKDQERIKCACGQPAEVCEHAEWHTGNTAGISFWYYCMAHGVARGYTEAKTATDWKSTVKAARRAGFRYVTSGFTPWVPIAKCPGERKRGMAYRLDVGTRIIQEYQHGAVYACLYLCEAIPEASA